MVIDSRNVEGDESNCSTVVCSKVEAGLEIKAEVLYTNRTYVSHATGERNSGTGSGT